MRTWPTPLAFSSRCLISLSAICVTSRRGRGGGDRDLHHGRGVGIELLNRPAASRVCGRSGEHQVRPCSALPARRRRRSYRARSVTSTSEWPSEEVERTSSIWLMVLTASSIFLVISVSISSGDAPGLSMVTDTVGISTLGNEIDAQTEVGEASHHDQRQNQHGREDRTSDAQCCEFMHGLGSCHLCSGHPHGRAVVQFAASDRWPPGSPPDAGEDRGPDRLRARPVCTTAQTGLAVVE